jgi:Ni/Fe-hydrogenase subunit HybB-like protein
MAPAAAVREGGRTAETLLQGLPGDAELTDQLLAPLFRLPRFWWPAFWACAAGTVLLLALAAYTVAAGVGVWGINIPVAWAFAIVNFVWWIGIGHAGTFISAFLLLMSQRWRASINRIAESMTLFALVNAALFPLLHLGRPWFFYWLLPYPNARGVWPQFRSPLPWDLVAVLTYFVVSLLFWYMGLVPDLAAVRDRVHGQSRRRRRVYGVLALGWKGSGLDWSRYRAAYGLLAALAAPLVISVHSIVSLDFTTALVPGWHSTIFPPYFVVGALYSGFAMVLVLLVPLRRIYRFENVITEQHLNVLGKMLLATGWMLLYSYVVEIFIGWYTGDVPERYAYLVSRPLGPYAVLFWASIVLNLVVPQVFWSRRLRRSGAALWAASLLILVGMWLERFIIVVGSLGRDFLPSSWSSYSPTRVDWEILVGTVALFGLFFLLLVRFVPFIPVHEVKRVRHLMHAGEA